MTNSAPTYGVAPLKQGVGVARLVMNTDKLSGLVNVTLKEYRPILQYAKVLASFAVTQDMRIAVSSICPALVFGICN